VRQKRRNEAVLEMRACRPICIGDVALWMECYSVRSPLASDAGSASLDDACMYAIFLTAGCCCPDGISSSNWSFNICVGLYCCCIVKCSLDCSWLPNQSPSARPALSGDSIPCNIDVIVPASMSCMSITCILETQLVLYCSSVHLHTIHISPLHHHNNRF